MKAKSKTILLLLGCPLTNQARMLNFIDTLSKENDIIVFAKNDQNNHYFKNPNSRFFTYSIGESFKTRILKHSFFWLVNTNLYDIVLSRIKNKSIDLIISFDLPVLYAGIRLKKYFKTKLYYDSLEIYTETLNQFFPGVKGIKKYIANILVWLMRYTGQISEKRMIQQVDHMSTVNKSLKDYFEKKYDISGVNIIMNCPKINWQETTNVDLREKYGFRKSDKIFIYQGVLNQGRGLEILIDGFNKAYNKNDSLRLIILGEGVLLTSLKNKVEEYNLEKVVLFHDFVKYVELINYTMAADYGINLLESFNLSKKLASPNKLFEYIQAGIPVLCSYSIENELVFRKFSIGILTENNPDSICSAILEISEKDKVYNHNINLAKKVYCWENQEKILLQIVDGKKSV